MPNETPDGIVCFTRNLAEPVQATVSDPALVAAPYDSSVMEVFADSRWSLSAGYWTAKPLLERCNYEAPEFCHILEGQVRLTDDTGRQCIYGPGESFIIKTGFSGTWENLTIVKKIYVIISP